ncbi:MAG: hypothetical protein U0798_02715 [Gemmataceae bacterium]
MMAAVVGAVVFLGCAALQGSVREVILSYQAGFVFWLDVVLGAFSLTMLAYLTTASWGLIQRRIFQAIMRTWWLFAILFLPILASLFIADGKYSPFWWSIPTAEFTDVASAQTEINHQKADWLNPSMFAVRAVIYFVVFGVYMMILGKVARKSEDQNDANATSLLRKLSGPGVVLWALLVTFLTTDWVMSVEPHWASTMFPVIFAVNGFLTAHAFGVFTFYSLNQRNKSFMDVYVKDKFRLDMGTLLLGLAMVWSYASFCQFMLIWAGNLPDEITYYLKRGGNDDYGWRIMCYILIFFHWLTPFVVLLFKEVKLHPNRMRVMCGMLILVCMVDVIWWIVPAFEHEGKLHVPMAFGAMAMVGGIFGLVFANQLKQRGILPPEEAKFLAEWGHHH